MTDLLTIENAGGIAFVAVIVASLASAVGTVVGTVFIIWVALRERL